jgi:hypothetical protein
MREIFASIPGELTDVVIYGTILLVFLSGLFKCIFPYRRGAGLFRRAIRSLEFMKPGKETEKAWQEPLFLGNPMEGQWSRFLRNARHLDQKGLTCNTEDYINDEDIFADWAHLQLAEVIPGLLTSLGILGTFIGLMRGLGNLDISSADSTMQGISSMISGMTFAYGTSIAGIAASLAFNVFFRTAQGSALKAMDTFNDTFAELVMQHPVDDSVYIKALMEGHSDDMSQALSDGVSHAIERSFVPISQSMSNFIAAQTQGQLKGLDNIVNHFIAQMNVSLGGQFGQLAQTLSAVNQSQAVGHDALARTMNAADTILSGVSSVQGMTQELLQRFEGYIAELSRSQSSGAHMTESMQSLVASMHESLNEQSRHWEQLVQSQADIDAQMQQYAAWSGRVLDAVDKQSAGMLERTGEIAAEMSAASKQLSGAYTGFVENISTGLARTMGLFEENMHDMMRELGARLKEFSKAQNADGKPATEIAAMSKMQQTMAEMADALNRAIVTAEQTMAERA